MPTDAPISPGQAAQVIGVSRRTIMRAIERRELQAQRDNRNRWKIAPDDLNKWASAQWSPSEQEQLKAPTLPTPEALELVVVKAERDGLKERLAETQSDRDRWREMAEKLANRPGWWAQIWQRIR